MTQLSVSLVFLLSGAYYNNVRQFFVLTSMLGAHEELYIFFTGVNGTQTCPLDSE